MEKLALMMTDYDSVAIMLRNVKKGEEIPLPDGKVILAQEDIPMYHKAAVKNIGKGEPVLRYGEEIGYATKDICAGEWVHVHNLDAEKIM